MNVDKIDHARNSLQNPSALLVTTVFFSIQFNEFLKEKLSTWLNAELSKKIPYNTHIYIIIKHNGRLKVYDKKKCVYS